MFELHGHPYTVSPRTAVALAVGLSVGIVVFFVLVLVISTCIEERYGSDSSRTFVNVSGSLCNIAALAVSASLR